MRASPFPRHGSFWVPTPLEPSGQSSRSLGGAGVGGGGGGVTTAAEALGFAGGSSFCAGSSQPSSSVASANADRIFDDRNAGDMNGLPLWLRRLGASKVRHYSGSRLRCHEVAIAAFARMKNPAV